MWEHSAKIKGFSMSQRPTITEALTGYAMSLAGHAWAILRFRHRGQGLAGPDAQLLTLGLIATFLAFTTAAVTPSENISHSAVIVGAIAAASFAASYSFFGRVAAAGFIITTIVSEPVAIAFRAGGLAQIDTILSVWVLAAQIVFFARTSGLQAKAK